jgi:hypothetical protein
MQMQMRMRVEEQARRVRQGYLPPYMPRFVS